MVINITISVAKTGMKYGLCQCADSWADPTPQGPLRPGSPSLTWTHPEPLLNWRAASIVTPGGRASWESWLCLGVSKLGHRQLSQEALTEVCSTGKRQTSLCLPPGPLPLSPPAWDYPAICAGVIVPPAKLAGIPGSLGELEKAIEIETFFFNKWENRDAELLGPREYLVTKVDSRRLSIPPVSWGLALVLMEAFLKLLTQRGIGGSNRWTHTHTSPGFQTYTIWSILWIHKPRYLRTTTTK